MFYLKCDGLYLCTLTVSKNGVVKGSSWGYDREFFLGYDNKETAEIVARAIRKDSHNLKDCYVTAD